MKDPTLRYQLPNNVDGNWLREVAGPPTPKQAEEERITAQRIAREDQTSRWRPVAGHGERKDRDVER